MSRPNVGTNLGILGLVMHWKSELEVIELGVIRFFFSFFWVLKIIFNSLVDPFR